MKTEIADAMRDGRIEADRRQLRVRNLLRAMVLCVGVLDALGIAAVAAEPAAGPPVQAAHRPKIGLVLGGGGARGAAHVGVLKVIEELRIPIDYIAGTSMGAIVGALYAAGLTPAQIDHELNTIDWDAIFDDEPPRPDQPWRRKRDDDVYLVKYRLGIGEGGLKFPLGVVQGQKFDIELSRILAKVAGIRDFDRLSIPFRAVATDIETGEAAVLRSGSLEQSVRASMAVPGAFGAVEIDGRLLVDGFVANNVPIDVARSMGAEVLIVVDVGEPLKTRKEIQSVFGILGQVTGLLSQRNVRAQLATLKPTDIYIAPALGDFSASDFQHAAKAIAIGQAAAEASRPALAALVTSPDDYSSYARAREAAPWEVPVIEFVHLDNDSGIGDDVVLRNLDVELGKPFDREHLERGIADLYGQELFRVIRYELVEENGATGLLVHVDPRPWGPEYLQFGLALSSDFEGDSLWDLGVLYRKTGINALAGELAVALQIGENPLAAVDLYQPLEPSLRWFVQPGVIYAGQNISRFDQGDEIEEFRVHRYGGALAAGRNLGRWGEVRAGVRRYAGTGDVRIGDPTLADIDFQSAEVFLRLSYDTVDNRNFPRHGAIGSVEWLESVESLGADTNFSQLLFTAGATRTWSRNTAFGGVEFNYTAHGTAPLQNRFRIGGFTRLSGFGQDELSGQQVLVLRSGFYRRVDNIQWLPVYVGATLEYGNVYEDRDDISLAPDDALLAGSVFVGLDLPIGPLYLGYGHAERGNDSMFLYLGRLF